MKHVLFFLFWLSLLSNSYSQGVAIQKIDSINNNFTSLLLKSSNTVVTINNQIATTLTTQVFVNNTVDSTGFKYAFPLPEKAAATLIRWNYTGQWQTASMIAAPQDSTFNADSVAGTTIFQPATLDTFLGNSPLYFPVDIPIAPGATISVELTYVELLPYQNNYVSFFYPGRYNLIQPTVDSTTFNISIDSYRQIDSVLPKSYTSWAVVQNGNYASLSLNLLNSSLPQALQFDYLLHPDSVGFFSFSTFYPDSIEMCDSLNGFFSFIVEPNSEGANDIIAKDFVLIIDHSGSMSGIKMTQANEAAEFIVNNLNSGDRFNIVQFDNLAESMSPQFLDYTLANKNAALNYISGISASGSTNISGSFDLSVPMFSASGNSRAKIIVFFTDGVPSAGITDETLLVSHVTNLIATTTPDISLYVFGIGSDVNTQLLAQLAAQNNGSSAFLANNNVAAAISNFYLTIQSPVLLNTAISFNPPIVSEVYPNPLPSLFKGQQLIVTGRYVMPGPVDVTLSGVAFGNSVSYQYTMNLTDSLIEKNSFLPKIWAKSKIDYLMTQYYLNQSNSSVASAIQKQIAALSLCRGVISPFTSFNGANNGGGGLVGFEEDATENVGLGLYPNPSNGKVTITIPEELRNSGSVRLSIFSIDGREITTLVFNILTGDEICFNVDELTLDKGVYLITLQSGSKRWQSRLTVF